MRITRQIRRRIIAIAGSALAAVTLVVIASLFYRPTLTRGSSMSPTLRDGDWCVARVWRYTPERGDVVVIQNQNAEGQYIVKRIMGLSGDVIDINYDTGKVVRNGRVLQETFAPDPILTHGDIEFPLTVPEGKAFVLGDNRNHSTDSRTSYTGMIDHSVIEGQIVLRIFPINTFGKIE